MEQKKKKECFPTAYIFRLSPPISVFIPFFPSSSAELIALRWFVDALHAVLHFIIFHQALSETSFVAFHRTSISSFELLPWF